MAYVRVVLQGATLRWCTESWLVHFDALPVEWSGYFFTALLGPFRGPFRAAMVLWASWGNGEGGSAQRPFKAQACSAARYDGVTCSSFLQVD